MIKHYLNGLWKLTGAGYETEGNIPGSVYSILLKNGLMEDPHYRDNEIKALELMDNEFVLSKKFYYEKTAKNILLVCEGIDTLCDLYLNGKYILRADNMHRTYKINVSEDIINGENEIVAVFPPLDKHIKELDKDANLIFGSWATMKGYMHVRKAHCMFGWDWGPMLPDAGIWRDIYLMNVDEPYISDVRILQRHEDGKVFLTVLAETEKKCAVEMKVKAPDGTTQMLINGEETEIENPQLWWPHGYGKQNLYEIECSLVKNGKVIDQNVKRVGLRTLELCREPDEWGESFCHKVNGIKIFAMGADYIPQDNILSRITKEKTRELLEACIFANFNAIRVWGGGYYPDDYFFDLCDELGLIVFFDLMFACASYPFGEEFTGNVVFELFDNLKRIRHHACIGVISGNNEIEEGAVSWPEKEKKGYLELFEEIIPEIINDLCPEIPYVPSSPSSHGKLIDPRNENIGDSHYWAVWHFNKPFTEYRNHYFRYLSEFGFQSFPTMKTIEEFTIESDRNAFSRVMELHQRNAAANGKILNYLSQNYLYPSSFENLVYASQLLQSEAMKYGVEHLRRNRGRCMGTLYWQLNDIWPVASWSSIDSAGRFKALHYFAKRFYEPVLISCRETGEYSVRKDITDERIIGYETKAQLYITNDKLEKVEGVVDWALRSVDGTVISSGSQSVAVEALSVLALDEMDFNKTNVRKNYLYYTFTVKGKVVSEGSVIFTKPKHFDFENPELTATISGDEITVKANSYAKFVEISNADGDLVLSDNYFDMNKGEFTVKVISGNTKNIKLKSVYDIR